MRAYTMAERPRCKWVGSLGVAAGAPRVDRERQLVGLVIDVVPATVVGDVSRRDRHVLGLHATIRDG